MGYVYVLRSGDEDLFKIGRTSGPVSVRVKELSTGNPHPLTEYASVPTDQPSKVESFLHGLLFSKRSRRSDATEFYELSSMELDAALDQARQYAETELPLEAEAERLSAEVCEDRLVTPDDADWDTYMQLLHAREQHHAATYAKDRLEWRLKLRIGSASGLDGVAFWRTFKRPHFDSASFARDYPDLQARYTDETHYRRFDLQ